MRSLHTLAVSFTDRNTFFNLLVTHTLSHAPCGAQASCGLIRAPYVKTSGLSMCVCALAWCTCDWRGGRVTQTENTGGPDKERGVWHMSECERLGHFFALKKRRRREVCIWPCENRKMCVRVCVFRTTLQGGKRRFRTSSCTNLCHFSFHTYNEVSIGSNGKPILLSSQAADCLSIIYQLSPSAVTQLAALLLISFSYKSFTAPTHCYFTGFYWFLTLFFYTKAVSESSCWIRLHHQKETKDVYPFIHF